VWRDEGSHDEAACVVENRGHFCTNNSITVAVPRPSPKVNHHVMGCDEPVRREFALSLGHSTAIFYLKLVHNYANVFSAIQFNINSYFSDPTK
jgi:hypothetical protein